MTLDDFARLGATTARQVRALQSAGVLPPPVLRARTGYYGPEHRRILRSVLRLQEQGFSLAAIGTLLAAWQRGETIEDVLGLRKRTRRDRATAFLEVPGLPDELDPFAEFVGRRRPRTLLSVVPSPILEGIAGQAAS